MLVLVPLALFAAPPVEPAAPVEPVERFAVEALANRANSSASGSKSLNVLELQSITISISKRSSSHLKRASSYWFLRMCLKDELSSEPIGILTHCNQIKVRSEIWMAGENYSQNRYQ